MERFKEGYCPFVVTVSTPLRILSQVAGGRPVRTSQSFACISPSLLLLVIQSCPTLCHPMDCSLPSSSVHGIIQARILEWVATSFSRDFPDQELNLGLLHCGQIIYRLIHKEIPYYTYISHFLDPSIH